MVVFGQQSDGCKRVTFPALAVNPVDVAGAGDSLLAVLSLGLASKQDLFKVTAISCCISAIAVQQLGNTPIPALVLEQMLKAKVPI